MASNRAPKHDFAPAWLKIPDSDSHKSSGPKQTEHGDRSGWGRPPPRGPPMPHEDFYGDRRGYPPPSKNRHHSLEDDYYNYYGYYGNGYSGWGGNGNFRSQNGRDCPPPGKYGGGPRYPPPPGPPMNGFRPPPPHPPPPPMGNGGYYDPYYGGGKDYYEPPYYAHHPNNRPPSAAGRRLYDSRNSNATNSRADKENKQIASSSDSKKKKEPNLEEEFPSLIGEGDPATPAEVKTAKTLNSSGVWDNPRETVKHNTSNIYKALIPNKGNLSKKGSLSKDHRDVNSSTSHFSKVNKESRIMSPSVDVLTRTKTQPKKLADKKSDFLKQLKKEKPMTNGDLKSAADKENGDEEHLANGMSELNVDFQNGTDEEERSRHSSNGSNFFSASLEAEQRLLKEMGWTEDDEEYVITEDEKKETQKKFQQLKQEQQGRNGLVHSAVARCFSSPQHHAMFTPPRLDADDVLTSSSDSSSSDSDSDAESGGC